MATDWLFNKFVPGCVKPFDGSTTEGREEGHAFVDDAEGALSDFLASLVVHANDLVVRQHESREDEKRRDGGSQKLSKA